jgi:prophage antirepressor-like protein
MIPTYSQLVAARTDAPKSFTFHLSESASFTVRAVLRDGEPWFVAADVCAAIEIVDVRQAVERLDDSERGGCTVPTPGGPQEVRAVNESGLYALIFTSRKPEAQRFRRWVTGEVLPAIRKTGGYQQPAPVELSRMEILRLAMDAEEAKIRAEAERDEAIRTKSLIGSKREASAMATAAAAKRETKKAQEKVNALTLALGHNAMQATVKAVDAATGKAHAWQPLRAWCRENGVIAAKVTDPLYGEVTAWPSGAWAAAHDIDLAALFA